MVVLITGNVTTDISDILAQNGADTNAIINALLNNTISYLIYLIT